MRVPKKVRNITKWMPYSEQRRNKQMWHINKSNAEGMIEQFKGFLEIVLEKKLENKKWRGIKEILKREMSRRGLCAPRISDSRIGTLKSEIYQMGFIKYNPDGSLEITKAGKKFLEDPKGVLTKQFIKLQFTNPTIINHCKDIYLFPIRGLMKLLLELDYLTKEEIGYIVFLNYFYEDDFENIKEKIIKFRNLPQKNRQAIINKFKKTPEGHVALTSASSVTYLCSKLKLTGVFDYTNGVLRINPNSLNFVKKVLEKYKDVAPYPYEKDDLDLWFEYFGDPNQDYPPEPKTISFTKKTNEEKFISIFADGKEIAHFTMNTDEVKQFPFFNGKRYEFVVFDLKKESKTKFEITTELNKDIIIDNESEKPVKLDEHYLKNAIIELCDSKDFDKDLQNKIEFLKEKYGDCFERSRAQIRGGRLEELFYKLLKMLKEKGVLKEVIWKGGVDELGLPHPTPGGPKGNPDIVFIMDDNLIILELTTQKARSSQENAETFSIVRHVRNFETNNKDIFSKYGVRNVLLIFSAPILHADIVKTLEKIFQQEKGFNYKFLKIEELLEILTTNPRRLLS